MKVQESRVCEGCASAVHPNIVLSSVVQWFACSSLLIMLDKNVFTIHTETNPADMACSLCIVFNIPFTSCRTAEEVEVDPGICAAIYHWTKCIKRDCDYMKSRELY